jgi:hypothetical protein
VSRTYLQSVLKADAALATIGTLGSLGLDSEALYAAESADDVTVFPFLTHRWGPVTKGYGESVRQSVDIWVHDRNEDYVRIDAILKRVKAILIAVVGAHTAEGWITQIDYEGSSPDLRDDGYDTITRNSTFTVIGSTR